MRQVWKTRHFSVLTDSFGRYHNYLRISLTEKCNLRCTYCMPENGVQLSPRDQLLSFSEQKSVIDIFSQLGVNKLRFTGGEPTLSKHLADLIKYARDLPNGMLNIGITTNAIQLNGRMLDNLVDAGLTSINISLDTLTPDRFGLITRRDKRGLMKVLSTIYAAAAKKLKVKVNCVLMRGINDDELAQFVEITRENDVDCRFIELMPFDGNEWSPQKFIGYEEVLSRLYSEGLNLQKLASVDRNDTTKWYGLDGHIGRIGFITSMSNHFCGTCNRLRITADGHLKVCLFGDEGLSLRDELRSGKSQQELIELIGSVVKRKKFALGGHSNPESIAKDQNRPMILIGG